MPDNDIEPFGMYDPRDPRGYRYNPEPTPIPGQEDRPYVPPNNEPQVDIPTEKYPAMPMPMPSNLIYRQPFPQIPSYPTLHVVPTQTDEFGRMISGIQGWVHHILPAPLNQIVPAPRQDIPQYAVPPYLQPNYNIDPRLQVAPQHQRPPIVYRPPQIYYPQPIGMQMLMPPYGQTPT
jgi:hypothetical protein